MKELQHPTRAGEQGVALIIALWLTLIVAGLVVTGTLTLATSTAVTRLSFAANNQAVAVARSGLTETLNWMRRQTSQPVTTFAPVLNTSVSPQILDTTEPEIGLVREFRITGSIWARYEVWKDWPTDPDPARRLRREILKCEDVSGPRRSNGQGGAWHIRSVGYAYRKVDSSVAFNEWPNYVIAKDLLDVEVQRLILTLPGQAAVNVADGNSCHVNTMGRILGGPTAGGIYYPQGTGTPTTGPANANRVTGTPSLAPGPTYNDSYEAVFGVPLSTLRSMATMIVTDMNDFPRPVPNGALVIVEDNNIQFDNSKPLLGNGIVIAIGNTMISPGSYSNFSGFLYVDGNFTMRDPSEIRGSVLVTGNMTLQGSGDYATILYDEDVLNALRANLGNYRFSTAIQRPRDRDY
jgi:hypothetical protein